MISTDDTLDAKPAAGSGRTVSGMIGQRLLRRLLPDLECGTLRVITPDGACIQRAGARPGPDACVVMRHWRTLRRLAVGGDIGLAESWIDGDWSSPDLTALIRLGIANTRPLDATTRSSRIAGLVNRVRHLRNRNSRSGSRQNILAHYDLGNDFYRLWLDPSMLYSSAIWASGHDDLESAQVRKLDRIAALTDIADAARVLEIGCGWGALATRLAMQHPNAHIDGITISPSQLAWARTAVDRAGVADRVALDLRDYRDLSGRYDRIVSIEMFEAVGETYWPQFFRQLENCLAERGHAVMQVITISEDRYEGYRSGVDFIQRHIFPGGFLPSKTSFAAAAAAAGLTVVHDETFGASYARTVAEWRRRFEGSWDAIAAQGFDERFKRLWNYYLSYCEAGFLEGTIDVGLYVLARPDTSVSPPIKR